MKNQVLSREQMQELIDMGIDVSKASMVWIINNSKSSDWEYTLEPNEDIEFWTGIGLSVIPTFTLQDILEILAKIYKTEPFESYYIEPINIRNNAMHFVKDWFDGQRDRKDILYSVKEDTLLKSAFNMLKWCKENNEI